MRLSYIAYCKDTTLGESRRHIAGYPRQKIATKRCKMVQASLISKYTASTLYYYNGYMS